MGTYPTNDDKKGTSYLCKILMCKTKMLYEFSENKSYNIIVCTYTYIIPLLFRVIYNHNKIQDMYYLFIFVYACMYLRKIL